MTREVTVTNALGLNASNAPLMVQKANSYKSSIWIQMDDRQINAKSLLGVISLGIKKGMTVQFIAEGEDAADALEGMSVLVAKDAEQ